MNEPASQDEGTAGAFRHGARRLLGAALRVASANYPMKGRLTPIEGRRHRRGILVKTGKSGRRAVPIEMGVVVVKEMTTLEEYNRCRQ